MSRLALTYPLLIFFVFSLFLLISVLVAAVGGNLSVWTWPSIALKEGLTSYVLVMSLLIYDRSQRDMTIGLNIVNHLPFLRDYQKQDKEEVKDEIWRGSLPMDLLLFIFLALATIWTL